MSRFRAWADLSIIATCRALLNGPASLGSGLAGSYGMSAGLVHGTGGPASTTAKVFDVPSVMSARRILGATICPGTPRGPPVENPLVFADPGPISPPGGPPLPGPIGPVNPG